MRKHSWLVPYLWNGLNGGLLGGAVAGIVIGVGYYLQSDHGQSVGIPEITVYALLVGATTAICTQLGIGWFRYLCRVDHYSPWFFNELFGGALGGLVGGIPVGALGGYWFGPRPELPIDPQLLLGGALLGSLVLAEAMVLYDSVGNWSLVFYSGLILLGMTVLLCAYARPLFSLLGIDDSFFARLQCCKPALMGGARLGTIVGSCMGGQIGLALLVYRHWQSQATHALHL